MLHRIGCVVVNGGYHLFHLYPSFQGKLHYIWFLGFEFHTSLCKKGLQFHYNKLQQHIVCNECGIDALVTCPLEEDAACENWWSGNVMRQFSMERLELKKIAKC